MDLKVKVSKIFIILMSVVVLLAAAGCSLEVTSVNNNTTVQDVKTTTEGTLTIHFIDVGQGAAQLLIGPTGKSILIDGGNNDDESLIVDYLKKQKLTKIDVLIGTHPHADHVGGLDAVINQFDIGAIYLPRVQANTKTFESVLLAMKSKGLKAKTAKAGVKLAWEDQIIAKLIAPVREYEDKNNMSAVLHVTFGNRGFLFAGDAEVESEMDIINSNSNIKADVILVGHHGSNSSSTQAFLDKIRPSIGIIQVGENSYGHPNQEILNRLKSNEIRIYRTDKSGTVTITSNGTDLNVITER